MKSNEFIPEESVYSSWVADLTFEEPNVIMTLNNGNVHTVHDVDEATYLAWVEAASTGQYWHSNIKNVYSVS